MSVRTQAFKLRTPIDPAFSISWIVAAGTNPTIAAGDPVELEANTGASDGTAVIAADAGPVITAHRRVAGIAKSDSSETASVAGTVQVWLPLPGIIYSGKAKTSANANTAAEIAAMVGSRVLWDLTSTTWSVDTAATDAYANGLVIVGGNHLNYDIYFMLSPNVTFLGNNIA